MSARQAQEPMDILSAKSMDQERFEGDTLCRIRLQISSTYCQGEICYWTALIISSPTFEMHKRYRDVEAALNPFKARDAYPDLTQDFSRKRARRGPRLQRKNCTLPAPMTPTHPIVYPDPDPVFPALRSRRRRSSLISFASPRTISRTWRRSAPKLASPTTGGPR